MLKHACVALSPLCFPDTGRCLSIPRIASVPTLVVELRYRSADKQAEAARVLARLAVWWVTHYALRVEMFDQVQ